MTWTGIILIASNLASSLLHSSYDRVDSFYWIRGSKLCFLTSFLLLSYSRIFAWPLLTSFLVPFLAAQESNFLSHFFKPWTLPGSMLYVHPHISGACHACFLRARHLWDPVSGLSTRFFSHLSSLTKVSGANVQWAIAYQPFSFFYT
jgi:hypothetical protein